MIDLPSGIALICLLGVAGYAGHQYWYSRQRAYLFLLLFSGLSAYQALLRGLVYEGHLPGGQWYVPDTDFLIYCVYTLLVVSLGKPVRGRAGLNGWLTVGIGLYAGLNLALLLFRHGDPFRYFEFLRVFYKNIIVPYKLPAEVFLLVQYPYLFIVSTTLLLLGLLLVAGRSRGALKAYRLGLIMLLLVTLHSPLIYSALTNGLPAADAMPAPLASRPTSRAGLDYVYLLINEDVAAAVLHLGWALQGIGFVLVLRFQSQQSGQNVTIPAS
ncbi:hypothetical protein GCM10023187_57630 [Nibrella viscosa]|uniref:Uncharacterized protein n=1 Tax=Nibrella viscosa TaxID=1084524 RepID=A0ABP8L3T4_9BACT